MLTASCSRYCRRATWCSASQKPHSTRLVCGRPQHQLRTGTSILIHQISIVVKLPSQRPELFLGRLGNRLRVQQRDRIAVCEADVHTAWPARQRPNCRNRPITAPDDAGIRPGTELRRHRIVCRVPHKRRPVFNLRILRQQLFNFPTNQLHLRVRSAWQAHQIGTAGQQPKHIAESEINWNIARRNVQTQAAPQSAGFFRIGVCQRLQVAFPAPESQRGDIRIRPGRRLMEQHAGQGVQKLQGFF